MPPDPLQALKITVQLAYPPGPIRCGEFLSGKASLQNTATRRIEFDDSTQLAYHWTRGDEVVVWDGLRTPLPRALDVLAEKTVKLRLAAPPRHGSYSLQFGIVRENRGWHHAFTADSVTRLKLDVDAVGTGRSPHAELNSDAARALYTAGYLRPLALVCETINVCNQSCVFCAYPHQTRPKGVMPMDLFESVLGQYEQIGGGAISFTTVGEVLLDPLLARRLDAIESRPSITGVSATTNATVAARLDEHKLDEIIPRLDSIQLSIYGLDAEENLRITGGHNYADMICGTRRILERAKSRVTLAFRTAASRDAIDHWLDGLFDLSSCRGAVEIQGPLKVFGNFTSLRTDKQPFTGATWRPNPGHKTQCLYPAAAIKVFWNGNVGFCACADYDNDDELDLGNVSTLSLAEVIRSDRFRRLWNWSLNGVPEICRRCTHYLPLSEAQNIPNFFVDPQATIGA